MLIFQAILAIGFVFTAACSATLTRTQMDDYSSPWGQKAGQFSVLEAGADSVIRARFEDGVKKATTFCGGRPMTITGASTSSSQSTYLMPVAQTNYYQGYSQGGGAFYGSGTTTSYVPVSGSTTRSYHNFVCEDFDRGDGSFVLRGPPNDLNGAMVCEEIPSQFAPGKKRIDTVRGLATSDDCLNEGWIRYLNKDSGIKAHIFVGAKGRELCKKLEMKMVNAQVRSSDGNLFLRKELQCKTASRP